MAYEVFNVWELVPGGPELLAFFDEDEKEAVLDLLREYEGGRVPLLALRKDFDTGEILARIWPDGSETPFRPEDLPDSYRWVWEFLMQ